MVTLLVTPVLLRLGPAAAALWHRVRRTPMTSNGRASWSSRSTSAAAGKTLSDLDLRRHTGASVIAVVRGETSRPNPSPEFVLEPGDDLVLVGSHEQVDRAFAHLR